MVENQKFCTSCGTPNPASSKFCINCGSQFPEIAYSQPVVPVSAAAPQANRSDFITLSCPNCGGKLQITPDIERFACEFCGYEHLVRRSGGMVSLEPVVQMMGQITNSFSHVGTRMNKLSFNTEKQAAELTIKRLKEEIAELQTSLGAYNEGSQNVLIAGGIFLSISGAAIMIGIMDIIPMSISLIVAGICVPIGIIIMASSKNAGKREKEALQQQIRQKEIELQRNYEFVRQFE